MILLLDAGNSRLKWGCYAGGQLTVGDPVAYTGSGLEANLERALGAIVPPTRVLLCSVAAAATQRRLTRWLRNRWRAPLAGVVPGRRGCGVRNAYPQPATLGADRWAALVGARAGSAAATCIVDAGTAVTVDLLTADGVHAGGLIVPGLDLARSSLDRRTGRIASTAGATAAVRALQLAQETRGAVRTGTLYQLVALLDRVVDDLAATAAGPLRGLLTGGDAATLLPLLRTPFEHRPHLVLEGLAELARKRCNLRPVPE